MASHLKTYLDYYKTCGKPGYAVLITGEWGAGKTFQVKAALKEEGRYYISLFGLSTTSEVHSAVLAAMDPKMAKFKEHVKGLGDVSEKVGGIFALGGYASNIIDAGLRQNVDSDRVIVFDDLERCTLPPKEILGVINTYVEHSECRVVVIAHDQKLKKKFNNTKEKIFGQTIFVEPQPDKAFDVFLKKTEKTATKRFIKSHKQHILGIFRASEQKNLRILRHVLEDLSRLYNQLDSTHTEHEEAMQDIVQLFTALNIEVRSGNLRKPDLEVCNSIQAMHSVENADEDETPLARAERKYYPAVYLRRHPFEHEILAQVLIEGNYDRDQVQSLLNNNPYFIQPSKEPPWKKVINFSTLEDEVVETALDEMQQQFDDRIVTDPGEMLHIFALRLLMADTDGKDIQAEKNACIKYIDDLQNDNRLPSDKPSSRQEYNQFTGHGGYGFFVKGSYRDVFKKIKTYLNESIDKAYERHLPGKANDLLKLLKDDHPQQFFEQVCHTYNGSNCYASTPILHEIAPEDFVDAWLNLKKNDWKHIRSALQERYETGFHTLQDEHQWARNIVNIIDSKAKENTEWYRKLRIKRLVPKTLREFVAR